VWSVLSRKRHQGPCVVCWALQQTLSLFFQDLLKSIILTVAIGGPVTAAIITIAKHAGPWLVPCLWAFSFLLSLFFLTIYPLAIAPLFNNFVPVSNSQPGRGHRNLTAPLGPCCVHNACGQPSDLPWKRERSRAVDLPLILKVPSVDSVPVAFQS